MVQPINQTRPVINTDPQATEAGDTSTVGTKRDLLPTAEVCDLPVLGKLHLLMIQNSQTNRKHMRQAEAAHEATETAADAEKISEMKAKAMTELVTGLASAGITVANGVATTVSAANTLSAMGQANAAHAQLDMANEVNAVPERSPIDETVKRLEGEVKQFDQALKLAEQREKVVGGAVQIAQGLNMAHSKVSEYAGSQSEIRITKLDQQSRAARRAADTLKNEQEAARQSEGKIMQLTQEIVNNKLACEKAALVRM
jgi:hypothetical protein